MKKEDLLKGLHEADVVIRKKIILRSGRASNFYIDIKKSFGNPHLFKQLTQVLSRSVDKRATAVAASGYGGIPLAVVVASLKNVPLTLVREKPKKHGKGGHLDGYVPTAKDRVVIIDDVFTTGSSIRSTLQGLRDTKAKIIGVCVVVRRTKKKFLLPTKHLFVADDFF